MADAPKTATFAGGCFWCVQHAFDMVPGVLSTTVGYTGGPPEQPTYQEVCSGTTGHVEAVQVTYDPKKVSYHQLLDVYWHSIDPTRNDGQFCDIGSQYQPIIFYGDEQQRHEAESSKNALKTSKTIAEVMVAILPASTFYAAEEYHQKYYDTSAARYQRYHFGSGRIQRPKELWEDT
jgi:methionine-S-sulfoxide reductase